MSQFGAKLMSKCKSDDAILECLGMGTQPLDKNPIRTAGSPRKESKRIKNGRKLSGNQERKHP